MSDSTGPAPASDPVLFETFWALVAEQGWQNLSLQALASRCDLTLAELRARVPYKGALPLMFARSVDQAVLRDNPAQPTGSARDRLFDVLMRRIDTLQPHRAGIIRLGRDMRTDPLLTMMLAPQLAASMAWMLEAAGIESSGIKGALRVQGLCGVWLATLRGWEQDEGQDLGATMAALDRALDRAGQIAGTLRLDVAESSATMDDPLAN
jgi:AcrR family transcriptional regulator